MSEVSAPPHLLFASLLTLSCPLGIIIIIILEIWNSFLITTFNLKFFSWTTHFRIFVLGRSKVYALSLRMFLQTQGHTHKGDFRLSCCDVNSQFLLTVCSQSLSLPHT